MAGGGAAGGYVWKGPHFSIKDRQRQNDNHITGETWKLIPNTDYAYYSTQGRFCTSRGVDFPYSGAYLCTEDELKEQVNYIANLEKDNIDSRLSLHKDYYTEWRNIDG